MDWLILIAGAFLAGLVDAVVGGGGLIQLPLLLAVHPAVAIPVLFATNKIASAAGTTVAAIEYARSVDIQYPILVPAVILALLGSALGAAAVAWTPEKIIRPAVLILLIGVGIYTFLKPDFGSRYTARPITKKMQMVSAGAGFGLGFYDGIFGPGTGSFLIFVFVRYFGMDLLRASACSKFVNVATNLAAIAFFMSHDGALLGTAFAMGIANIAGARVGTRLALLKGNRFIRYLLLSLLAVLSIKLGRDCYRSFAI